MKATELRIGNIIWNKDVQEIIIGIDVDKETQIIHTNKTSWLDISEIKPIITTSENLCAMGFEQDLDQAGIYYTKGKFTICEMETKGGNYEYGICLNGIDVMTPFLHQVQNLYFEIMKEELVLAVTPN